MPGAGSYARCRRGEAAASVRHAFQDAAFWAGALAEFQRGAAANLPAADAAVCRELADAQRGIAERASRAAAAVRCTPSAPRALAMAAAAVLGTLAARVGGAPLCHAATAAAGAAAAADATDALRHVIAKPGDAPAFAEEARALLKAVRDGQAPAPPPVPGVPAPVDAAARTALTQGARAVARVERCVRDDGA